MPLARNSPLKKIRNKPQILKTSAKYYWRRNWVYSQKNVKKKEHPDILRAWHVGSAIYWGRSLVDPITKLTTGVIGYNEAFMTLEVMQIGLAGVVVDNRSLSERGIYQGHCDRDGHSHRLENFEKFKSNAYERMAKEQVTRLSSSGRIIETEAHSYRQEMARRRSPPRYHFMDSRCD